MKIAVINGSPKGKKSNTNVMVEAFLKGAQEAGAETINIFLAEKEIKHCKGCHVCWVKGPCQCVTDDDMLGVLSHLGDANIIVFATPVYFGNISGMLKVFMDRMTMIGSPHSQNDSKKNIQESKQAQRQAQPPKLMMISNCGFPDRDEFQVISLWAKRVAQKMNMELIGEIYATSGKFLTSPPDELQSAIADYLLNLQEAGREIVIDGKLSEMTVRKLLQDFVTE
ncbi:flavodoxin family protein [Desulfosporosinus sp. PR]|uniref:flavodoxin family protein n=1 Tax=Candidatus Desulfosporosinus nitrosoreducens TaxID=3401928 RepID=UPI0027EF9B66|nr:flavodoxin family protein [Desulfosporosinus sp. PR]MDQ7092040.1 flavodoxin family protein [Desulfosporosinus sp. PR]